jgi:hypothetical protein
MRILHKQLAGFIIIISILTGALYLPISLVNAETQAITFSKLLDGKNYKETMFTIVDGNGTYNVLVRANITIDGSETLITLNGTLFDATNTTVTLSVAIPDTLMDHPIVGKVEAIHVHISEENVEKLVYVYVPIAFLGALLAELLLIVPLEIVNLITRYAPFVWASVP